MIRINRAVLGLLLLALPALSAGQSGQSDARIVKPEIRVGDNWTYRGAGVLSSGTDDYVTRVELSDGKTILTVSTRKGDGKEFDATYTSDWNTAVGVSGLVTKPIPQVFSFPLQIGSSRPISFEMQRPRTAMPPTLFEMTVKVAGWEDISVPAGRFRAIRIVSEGSFTRADMIRAVSVRYTYWYVPEVRRWAKLLVESPNSSTGEELLAYKLNED